LEGEGAGSSVASRVLGASRLPLVVERVEVAPSLAVALGAAAAVISGGFGSDGFFGAAFFTTVDVAAGGGGEGAGGGGADGSAVAGALALALASGGGAVGSGAAGGGSGATCSRATDATG
jgi:hypothetical protein